MLKSHPWKGKACFAAQCVALLYSNSLSIIRVCCQRNTSSRQPLHLKICPSTKPLKLSMPTLPLLTTTTPAPMPRRPHLLPLSDLIILGSPQGSLCLQTSPAQDHQMPFRHKALPLSSPSGAGSNSQAPSRRRRRLRGRRRQNPLPLPSQPRWRPSQQRLPRLMARVATWNE